MATDIGNCGACGNVCGPEQICDTGTCVPLACSGGATECKGDAGSQCVDTQNDNSNCGGCGVECPAGYACATGACARTCATPETTCGDSCVDPQTDRENCGACGNTCWAECNAGICAKATSIASGAFHTCGLSELGTVWCWGALGTASSVQVAGITTAEAVVAGSDFACAQLKPPHDGTLCWGSVARLATGLAQQYSSFPTPSQMVADVGHLVGGGLYATSNGGRLCRFTGMWNSVYCTGENGEGAIGDGTTTSPAFAVQSQLNADILAIGEFHTCSVWLGAASCVGSNYRGQLGNSASFGSYSTTPLSVSLSTAPLWLAAGSLHTCAVLSDKSVACWGDNTSGQLGNNTTTQSTSPVQVVGLNDLSDLVPGQTQLVAGSSHTCVIQKSGDVACWGSNAKGQLGDGTAIDSLKPTTVVGLPNAGFILASGANHVCAVLYPDGSVWCWGDNSDGQLGNGTIISSPTPVRVH